VPRSEIDTKYRALLDEIEATLHDPGGADRLARHLHDLPDLMQGLQKPPEERGRMEIMIDHSDAFVIFPGGSGTVQEMLALMIFKHQGHPSMTGKPVVIFNRKDAQGDHFWTPLIELLGTWCYDGEFVVVEELDDLIPALKKVLVVPKLVEA
jgi:hypothetical protein